MTAARLILAMIVLLQAADVVTTAIGLSRGLEEANPLVARLFGRLSPGWLFVAATGLKLVGSVPMAALCWFYPSWWPVPALYAASLVWVVRSNLRALRSD